jgi:hypothetical protein
MQRRILTVAVLLATLGVAGDAAARTPRFLWGDGTPRFGKPVSPDVAQARSAAGLLARPLSATSTIPLWTGSFTYQGVTYPYTMVGTDPALGSRTSSARVVIVPIEFDLPGGVVLSASTPACGSARSAVRLTRRSPLFASASFAPGGTVVGRTQYIDAFQRANFWSAVSTTAPGYHVKLRVKRVLPTQVITVPAASAQVYAGPCAPIGVVDFNFYVNALGTLFAQLTALDPGVLPVFLQYNVFLSDTSGCCILGFHSAFPVPGGEQTFVSATYSDPGIFNVPIEDIHALSHELGEWADDPLVNNTVPAWSGGQQTACSSTLENGDPVTGVAFPVTKGGVTYHPEDLVFLPWFSREVPSSSVNGWYSFLDSYPGPAAACP